MTLLLGDTGKVQIGSLKTFTITPGTARETLLGTPLTLPTTEPATSQVIMTVQSSDLPTISPSVPVKMNASLVCSGKIGAVASVVNYRVLKNGSSVAQASGASATATQYWSHTHWRTFDVQVGDVLEVRYWAVQADVTLDFYGLIIYPSQPSAITKPIILKDLGFTGVTNLPNFSNAFTVANTQYFRYYEQVGFQRDFTTDVTLGATYPNLINGFFRSSLGDLSLASSQYVHATQRQYQKLYYPQTISFREVLR